MAIGHAKLAITQGFGGPLDTGLAIEREAISRVFVSEDADEGIKRLEGLARFLEHDYESAARSLREAMAEMFTMQRLQLPPSPPRSAAGSAREMPWAAGSSS